jgi:hypothetical protein
MTQVKRQSFNSHFYFVQAVSTLVQTNAINTKSDARRKTNKRIKVLKHIAEC